MARPLSVSTDQLSKTPSPANPLRRWSAPGSAAPSTPDAAAMDTVQTTENVNPSASEEDVKDETQELELLQHENEQLRNLCIELEQALQEASQLSGQQNVDARLREYELLLEEKSDTIRQLHQELQNAHAIVADMEAQVNEALRHRAPDGPAPREAELLALSEELENERRQLQEDEQTLMQQMREMEVSMARERAEMARQRNDLARLQSDIRHELERLEKSGAAVRKMEELKRQFADATNRRGLAASTPGNTAAQQPQQQAPQPPPNKKDSSIMGRLFGGGK